MAFLSNEQIQELKGKLINDDAYLKKQFNIRKKKHEETSILYSERDDYFKRGWETVKEFKTKVRVKRDKKHDILFEDEMWCLCYKLGFNILNFDRKFDLPYGKNKSETQQIDVIAANSEVVLIIECKSSEKNKKYSYKNYFESLSVKLNGFNKSLKEIIGDRKLKYIFATRNQIFPEDSVDLGRLKKENGFHVDNNTFNYISQLVEKYKSAAIYQFMGLLFKNQIINLDKIKIPCVRGTMGGKEYYMFSIEPKLLLKIGFVLHRAKANVESLPTYQRLLVPSRLKGIGGHIDSGGYFPNSLIINFNETKKNKLEFQESKSTSSTSTKAGILKIPNTYSSAYIIDGQHRLYGYAFSEKFHGSNLVPVVAFKNLKNEEQLGIFVDINENQKAVNKTLRITLNEDLHWNSERTDSRMKALRAGIISKLALSNGPFSDMISIGEDSKHINATAFDNVLKDVLVPKAKGNKFLENQSGILYDINDHDNNNAMENCKNKTVELLNYIFFQIFDKHPKYLSTEKDDYRNKLVFSNRGIYPIIYTIGSVFKYLQKNDKVSMKTDMQVLADYIYKYLKEIFKYLDNVDTEELNIYLTMQGAAVQKQWSMFFHQIINLKYKDFVTKEFKDWQETKDQNIQNEGKEVRTEIEKFIKNNVLNSLEEIHGEDWEYNVGDIKIKKSAEATAAELTKKETINKRVKIHWTEMLRILDYKKMIEKNWSLNEGLLMKIFSINDEDTNNDIFIKGKESSKVKGLKWMNKFNIHRNDIAHDGTGYGISLEDLEYLKKLKRTLES